MTKKLFFFALALFGLSALSSAQAQTVVRDSGPVGANLTFEVRRNTANNDYSLRISGTGDMTDFSSTYAVPWMWKTYTDSITSITIGEGVTSIGNFAFGFTTWNNRVRSFVLPSTLKRIGAASMRDMRQLESINLPEGLEFIGNQSFGGLGVSSLTIPSTVTTIEGLAFSYMLSLEVLNFNASSNVNFGLNHRQHFAHNPKLTTVNIVEGITVLPEGFLEGAAISAITIPASVTRMGRSVFRNCANLKTVRFKGTTPPTPELSVFDGTHPDIKIFVPIASKPAYLTAWQHAYWSWGAVEADRIIGIGTLSVIHNAGGTVLLNGLPFTSGEVTDENDLVFTITPNAGFEIAQVLWNETDVSTQIANNTFTSSFTQNSTLEVSFVQVFSVSVNANAGGKVLIDGEEITGKNVRAGENATFTITPDAGFAVETALFNGADISEQILNNEFTVAITQNSTLEVVFVGKYSVSVTHNAGGTVLIDGNETASAEVNAGQSVKFTITPDADYEIVQVLFNEADVTSELVNNEFTAEINEHSVLEVIFVRVFTVSVSHNAGGTVLIDGDELTSKIVRAGENVTLSFVPDAHYAVYEVLIDGTSNATAIKTGTYTFSNLSANHAVSVTFKLYVEILEEKLANLEKENETLREQLAEMDNLAEENKALREELEALQELQFDGHYAISLVPTPTGVELHWLVHSYKLTIHRDVDGEDIITYIRIDVSGNVIHTRNSSVNSHIIEGLTSEAEYFYTFSSHCGADNLLFSTSGSFTTLADPGQTTGTGEIGTATRTAVAFFNLSGIKLGSEPQSGIYIVLYDDGTSEKVLR